MLMVPDWRVEGWGHFLILRIMLVDYREDLLKVWWGAVMVWLTVFLGLGGVPDWKLVKDDPTLQIMSVYYWGDVLSVWGSDMIWIRPGFGTWRTLGVLGWRLGEGGHLWHQKIMLVDDWGDVLKVWWSFDMIQLRKSLSPGGVKWGWGWWWGWVWSSLSLMIGLSRSIIQYKLLS